MPDATTAVPLRERVAQRIADPSFLSAIQRDAVDAAGDLFLVACPGSGKTRTIGVRVAWAAVDGSARRIAATSYTNVAIGQMRDVARELGVMLGPQHFTGTLHGFLLTYVLYPYARRLLDTAPRIRLQGEHDRWPDVVLDDEGKVRLGLNYFTYDRHRNVVVHRRPKNWYWLSREEAAERGAAKARKLKMDCFRRGLVSLDDAMYLAMQILERDERVRRALARRFTELVVDEAQDTSDTQLRCLELLHQTGELNSLVLVGDLEQSIYRFQGASPRACAELAQQRALREVELTENWRSSQAICDVTHKFVRRPKPDTAVGPHRAFGVVPELLVYPAEQPPGAIARFEQRLQTHGLADAEVAVLARGHDLREELDSSASAIECMKAVRVLGEAVAQRSSHGALARWKAESVDRLVAELAWGRALATLDDQERWRVRQVTMQTLNRISDLDQPLPDWIRLARTALADALSTLVTEPRHSPSHRLKSAKAHHGVRATERFIAVKPRRLTARTVHDVKGLSLGAVLLVLDRARSSKREAQTSLFARCLDTPPADDSEAEELRIAYVALTRAERYCALGVPSTCPAAELERFRALGFRTGFR